MGFALVHDGKNGSFQMPPLVLAMFTAFRLTHPSQEIQEFSAPCRDIPLIWRFCDAKLIWYQQGSSQMTHSTIH